MIQAYRPRLPRDQSQVVCWITRNQSRMAFPPPPALLLHPKTMLPQRLPLKIRASRASLRTFIVDYRPRLPRDQSQVVCWITRNQSRMASPPTTSTVAPPQDDVTTTTAIEDTSKSSKSSNIHRGLSSKATKGPKSSRMLDHKESKSDGVSTPVPPALLLHPKTMLLQRLPLKIRASRASLRTFIVDYRPRLPRDQSLVVCWITRNQSRMASQPPPALLLHPRTMLLQRLPLKTRASRASLRTFVVDYRPRLPRDQSQVVCWITRNQSRMASHTTTSTVAPPQDDVTTTTAIEDTSKSSKSSNIRRGLDHKSGTSIPSNASIKGSKSDVRRGLDQSTSIPSSFSKSTKAPKSRF